MRGGCREESKVQQSGPSRTRGGVQRSQGSSWALPASEAELDVQRSLASLRSLMSASEKPPSRLGRMTSMAFSKRHVRPCLAGGWGCCRGGGGEVGVW